MNFGMDGILIRMVMALSFAGGTDQAAENDANSGRC